MSKQIDALKLALEALEDACGDRCNAEYNPCFQMEAIIAIKEVLAQQCVCGEPNSAGTHRTDGPCLAPQPEQEPVETLAYKADYWKRMHDEVRAELIKVLNAQPEQEPVAWLVEFENGEQELYFEEQAVGETNTPLYINPPQRTWVGLTDEEICLWFQENTVLTNEAAIRITRAIEAKLKEKNK